MYGQQLQQAACTPDMAEPECSPCSPETLASINGEAIKTLIDSNSALEAIMRKVRGSQPKDAANTLAKVPERSVFGDAKELRSFAYQLADKIQSLGSLLG